MESKKIIAVTLVASLFVTVLGVNVTGQSPTDDMLNQIDQIRSHGQTDFQTPDSRRSSYWNKDRSSWLTSMNQEFVVSKKENEPNNNPETADRMQSGDQTNGRISSPRDVDVFTIRAQEGDSLTLEFTNIAEEREEGTGFVLTSGDPLTISIFAPNNGRILINEQPTLITHINSTQTVTIPRANQTGNYYIVIGEKGGIASYELTAEVKSNSKNSLEKPYELSQRGIKKWYYVS